MKRKKNILEDENMIKYFSTSMSNACAHIQMEYLQNVVWKAVILRELLTFEHRKNMYNIFYTSGSSAQKIHCKCESRCHCGHTALIQQYNPFEIGPFQIFD